MELDFVRKELDMYDNIIRNMINLRMSLIPIVADIKKKSDLPVHQSKREEQIYEKIDNFAKQNGADGELIKNIYKLIISCAVAAEEDIFRNQNKSIINSNVNLNKFEDINQEFEKLDNILKNELPEILSNISKKCDLNGMNINQVATLYYYNKK